MKLGRLRLHKQAPAMIRALAVAAFLVPLAAAAQPTKHIEAQPPLTITAVPKEGICRELTMTIIPGVKLTKDLENTFRREFEAFLRDAAKCESAH
jgi:hypothetical protein